MVILTFNNQYLAFILIDFNSFTYLNKLPFFHHYNYLSFFIILIHLIGI